MKRLFVIVSFCMTLCSCDPNSCVEYDIYITKRLINWNLLVLLMGLNQEILK